MRISVSAQQETAILKTIKELHAREYQKNVDRDSEFIKFLKNVYRSCESPLHPLYQGASQELLSSCADEVRSFKGVNKEAKEEDEAAVLKRIRFDVDEGKSWADQRRARWIVPLCVAWLDAVRDEVERLKSIQSLSESFLVETIVKLLTTSYHPPSRQSNTTQLICTQTMHHKKFRKRLHELTGIELPRPKERIGKWLNSVRENGLEREGDGSSAASQDVTLRRELELRNTALEKQLTECQQSLRECRNALAACQAERDELRRQLHQMSEWQSIIPPPIDHSLLSGVNPGTASWGLIPSSANPTLPNFGSQDDPNTNPNDTFGSQSDQGNIQFQSSNNQQWFWQ